MGACLAAASAAPAMADCPYTCADLNGDGVVNLADLEAFASCMGQSPDVSPECRCADMDGSGTIDLHDFALFAVLFGQGSDELSPNCTGAAGLSAKLTVYRPQHGAGYAPFARTAVAGADEESETLGPGIRINDPNNPDVEPEELAATHAPLGRVRCQRLLGRLLRQYHRDAA